MAKTIQSFLSKLIAVTVITSTCLVVTPTMAAVGPGTLVKIASNSAVYYVASDGKRYVFSNSNVYFSWYSNFSTVQTITDSELASLRIGGNVTYQPDSRMLKIQSDPKVYAVARGGTLRWITTEAVAAALYGANWNQYVDDVDVSDFASYKVGPPINVVTDYNKVVETANATSINSDQGLGELTTSTPPVSTPSPGQTYYVATTGNNSNSGSVIQPWKTPAFGADKLRAGDTLIIMGGTYGLADYEADILRPASGTATAWITIKGEAGKRPVLRGSNNLITAIELSNRRFIRLENLEITSGQQGQFREAIEALDGPADDLVFDNLYLHHLDEFCINIGDTKNIKILNSNIAYCGFGAIGGPDGRRGGWQQALIQNTDLSYSGRYYQGRLATSPYDRPDGFGVEESLGPIEFANVRAEFNLGDGLDSKVDNTYIHESTVANNSADGIKLWGTNGRVENTLIYGRGGGSRQASTWSPVVITTEKSGAVFNFTNVTIDDALGANYVMHSQYDFPNVPVTINFKNVIVSSRGPNAPLYISKRTTLNMDNVLFYAPQSASEEVVTKAEEIYYNSSQISTLGSSVMYGDPLFFAPVFGGTRGDYRLKPASPALNSGVSSGLSVDLTGGLRLIGTGVDLGALEQ